LVSLTLFYTVMLTDYALSNACLGLVSWSQVSSFTTDILPFRSRPVGRGRQALFDHWVAGGADPQFLDESVYIDNPNTASSPDENTALADKKARSTWHQMRPWPTLMDPAIPLTKQVGSRLYHKRKTAVFPGEKGGSADRLTSCVTPSLISR